MNDMKLFLTLLISVIVGLAILKIDSQPTWDDTGVTAGMLFVSTALISLINPKRPFMWGLAVGIWIPLFAIINHGNYPALLSLIFSLAGAYAGSAFRNAFLSHKKLSR